jgi:hypothetical protein
MANCSSGLLGVIVRNTFHFIIPVVPLLALKIRKDLSEIAGWLSPTKKDMGLSFSFSAVAAYLDINKGQSTAHVTATVLTVTTLR